MSLRFDFLYSGKSANRFSIEIESTQSNKVSTISSLNFFPFRGKVTTTFIFRITVLKLRHVTQIENIVETDEIKIEKDLPS